MSRIQSIRTYHDDFERVKKVQSAPIISEKKTEPTAIPKKEATKPALKSEIEKKTTPVQDVRPEKKAEKEKEAVSEPEISKKDGPVENPPFHYIRATNLGDSSIGTSPKAEKNGAAVKKEILQSKIDLENVRGLEGKKSVLTKKDNVFDVDAAHSAEGEGSIITDTKSAFRIFPSIIKSITHWFVSQKEHLLVEEGPRYTINMAKDRQETIERAGTQSALAPKDDYAKVTERLKEVPRSAKESKMTIRDASEAPKPTWLSNKPEKPKIEVKGAFMEAKTVSPETPDLDTAPKKEAVEKTTIEIPATPKAKAKPQGIPKEKHTNTVSNTAPKITGEQQSKKKPSAEEKTPAIQNELIMPVAIQKDGPEMEIPQTPSQPETKNPEETSTPEYQHSFPYAAGTGSQNKSALLIVAVSIVAVILGVATVFWFSSSEDTVLTETTQKIPAIAETDEYIGVPLTDKRLLLLDNILNTQPRTVSQVTQVYPSLDTEGEKPASTEQVLNVLTPRAPGNFIRSITDIGFGLYQGTNPFIVIKVKSFDVALSGMLEWEPSMSPDLSPLFGEPVSGTFDPNARTANQAREPFFVDVIDSNLDMRILQDEIQNDRISYSFLNSNTILITNNRDTLSSLAPLIK